MTLLVITGTAIVVMACIYVFAPANRIWTGPPLSYTRCRPCGGLGAQWLNGKKWVIIPPELRDRQEDRMFHPPLANIRRCPACNGIGHIWGRRGSKTET